MQIGHRPQGGLYGNWDPPPEEIVFPFFIFHVSPLYIFHASCSHGFSIFIFHCSMDSDSDDADSYSSDTLAPAQNFPIRIPDTFFSDSDTGFPDTDSSDTDFPIRSFPIQIWPIRICSVLILTYTELSVTFFGYGFPDKEPSDTFSRRKFLRYGCLMFF